ncbi:hypothetical protein Tco_1131498 [Tanacetum coccineum]
MEKLIKRRNVIQIGRKAVNLQKGAPSVQTHTDWDGLDTDLEATLNEAMDYTLAQDKGKTDSKGGSTKSTDLQQSTVKPDESTVKPDESTVKQDEGTDRQVEGTAENKDQNSKESATIIAPTTTLTPTSMVFGDDETIAQVLVTMSQNKVKQKEKEKGKLIDPKAKGKGIIEEEDESDTESEDITEAEKKFKMLANDEEMAEKVQEEWEAEEKKEMLVEEEAAKIAFTNEYDFIQPRLNADKILAEKEISCLTKRIRVIRIQTFLHKNSAEKPNDEIFEAFGKGKKLKSRKRRFRQDTSEDNETNSEKENDELGLCLTIALDEDKEVDYEILDKNNGQRRYFSTLMRVLSIFDRDDLCAVYQLVMDKYKDEILEDFDIVLWGDLMIMFNPSDEDEFWNSQQDWNVVSWKLHGSSGVHTLMTEAGLVIHMLVEKKYHLRKNICFKLLDEVGLEEDSTMPLELI